MAEVPVQEAQVPVSTMEQVSVREVQTPVPAMERVSVREEAPKRPMSYDPNEPTNVDRVRPAIKSGRAPQNSGISSGKGYEPYGGNDRQNVIFDIKIETDDIPEYKEKTGEDPEDGADKQ